MPTRRPMMIVMMMPWLPPKISMRCASLMVWPNAL
jgi:hypothetical protein